MKAVILCGGEGSRLRPLTCDTPKPLAHLCGRPVLTYLLDNLHKAGVTEAFLTVRYLSLEIVSWFDLHPETRIQLHFITEDTPLGTAGSVGSCRDALTGDPFLVVSGDGLFDYDLKAAVEFHQKRGAMVTLLTAKVDDPREYGCVITDGQGKVERFAEKPDWSGAVSNRANTGIYILDPSVLDLIPRDRAFDFASDLFPLMLGRDLPLYAKAETGYWCDIGSMDAYLQCQFDVLSGRAGDLPEAVGANGILCRDGKPPEGNYTLLPPVWLGSGVTIGEGAVIGPEAVIEDGCHIGCGSTLRRTVVLSNVYVGSNCELRGAILCKGASLESTGRMFEGSVLGANARVGVGATVGTSVRLWPGKRVDNEARVNQNVKWGHVYAGVFDDDGISGENGSGITPDLCVRAGQALATVMKDGPIFVGHDGHLPSRMCYQAFVSGVTAAGGEAVLAGLSFDTLISSTVRLMGFAAGVFFDSAGNRTTIRLCGRDGLTLTRRDERAFSSALSGGEFARCGWDGYREPHSFEGAAMLSEQVLCEDLKADLNGFPCRITCCCQVMQDFANRLSARLGLKDSGDTGLRFHIGSSGHTLSGFDENGDFLSARQMELIVCGAVLREGDMAVPSDAPAVLETMAASYGRQILRYTRTSDGRDAAARRMAATQRYTVDAFAALLCLLRYLWESGLRLADLAMDIPHLETREFRVHLDGNVQEAVKRLAVKYSGRMEADGLRIGRGSTDCYCQPSKRGDALRICVRSTDMEAARDFGDEIRRSVKR